MADQTLLAKIGLRLGVLGTSAALALAAPLAAGDYSVTAATAASRIGFYFDRTAAAEKIGVVVMASEMIGIGVLGIGVNVASVSGNGLLQMAFGSTKAFGVAWDGSTNLYPTASGALKSDATLNGLMAANSFVGNNTAGVALSTALSAATVESLLPDFIGSGASHAKGRVPDPGATAGITKFLREDATFAVPGSVGSPLVTANATTITITNTTETSIFGSYSVAGGTLTTAGDKLRLLIKGTWVQNAGGNATGTIRVKIGGVTVYASGCSGISTNANTKTIFLEIYFTYITSTTADVVVRINVGNATVPSGVGIGSLLNANNIDGTTGVANDAAWTWASNTAVDITFQDSTATNQTVTINSSHLSKMQ